MMGSAMIAHVQKRDETCAVSTLYDRLVVSGLNETLGHTEPQTCEPASVGRVLDGGVGDEAAAAASGRDALYLEGQPPRRVRLGFIADVFI